VAVEITIAPIAEGMVDEWREFVNELRGPRRIEWAQSQRSRGISRQVMALTEGDPVLAVVYTEAGDTEQAGRRLADSVDAFDVWYRERVAALHGDSYATEVAFDSAPKPGPWRGWR